MADHAATVEEQIRYGFLRTTCRKPQQDEIDALTALYDTCGQGENLQPPLQVVASVLLNLDEIVKK
jgi:hypothetical protein